MQKEIFLFIKSEQTGKSNCLRSTAASALTCIDSESENSFPWLERKMSNHDNKLPIKTRDYICMLMLIVTN